jgi:hypothetical protein
MLRPYNGVTIKPPKQPLIKRRFSVTQDIVGFRRCGRQYGTFHVHKYAPAYQTQLYFGTILHQVLDRCHSHYHGILDPTTKGQIPDGGTILSDTDILTFFDDLKDAEETKTSPPPPPSDMLSYFIEVEDSLKSQGIRAIDRNLRLKALRILQYFNHLEGPVLYPQVKDTEYRLQADQKSHILHGVVDLLLDSPGSSNPNDCEIWDYKGTSRINLTQTDRDTYLFQMRVYARLYELKHNVLPRKVVLYFLSELDGATCPRKRPANALLELTDTNGLSRTEIDAAMTEFDATVQQIEQARQLNVWQAAAPGCISPQDCAICDLRWDCPTHKASMRYP